EAGRQAAGQKTRGDFELVAEVPDADLLAGELARVVEPGVLPGHRQGAGALEDLRDVDQVGRRRRLTGLEDLGDPADRELRAVGRHRGARGGRGPALRVHALLLVGLAPDPRGAPLPGDTPVAIEPQDTACVGPRSMRFVANPGPRARRRASVRRAGVWPSDLPARLSPGPRLSRPRAGRPPMGRRA